VLPRSSWFQRNWLRSASFLWGSRPRLSSVRTAEGGCPTFGVMHPPIWSTYSFAAPKPGDGSLGVGVGVRLVHLQFRVQSLDVLIDQGEQHLSPLLVLPGAEQVGPTLAYRFRIPAAPRFLLIWPIFAKRPTQNRAGLAARSSTVPPPGKTALGVQRKLRSLRPVVATARSSALRFGFGHRQVHELGPISATQQVGIGQVGSLISGETRLTDTRRRTPDDPTRRGQQT